MEACGKPPRGDTSSWGEAQGSGESREKEGGGCTTTQPSFSSWAWGRWRVESDKWGLGWGEEDRLLGGRPQEAERRRARPGGKQGPRAPRELWNWSPPQVDCTGRNRLCCALKLALGLGTGMGWQFLPLLASTPGLGCPCPLCTWLRVCCSHRPAERARKPQLPPTLSPDRQHRYGPEPGLSQHLADHTQPPHCDIHTQTSCAPGDHGHKKAWVLEAVQH